MIVGNLAFVHDWVQNGTDAKDGKKSVNQCNYKDLAASFGNFVIAVESKGICHGPSKPCDPHHEHLLIGDPRVVGSCTVNTPAHKPNIEKSCKIHVQDGKQHRSGSLGVKQRGVLD